MEFEDWEVAPSDRPRGSDYGFDLDRALSSVLALRAEVPDDAFTADALGVERAGNAVLIRQSGIVLTIGYLITEAERVSLRTNRGQIVDGHVLGYDQSSGFGCIQALGDLDIPAIRLGDSRHAGVGDDIVVGGAGGRRRSLAGQIVARQEFAGYWEYLIEEAIFTAPSHPNWGGTALIGSAGELLGIGSLHLQQQTSNGSVVPLNMMVPIELLTPIVDDLVAGRAGKVARPWLGVYAQEMQKSVVVVGIAGGGPADRAGLRPGDTIRRAGEMDITNLADFYRSMWATGPAGVDIPLTMEREGDVFELRIASADRRSFLKTPRLH